MSKRKSPMREKARAARVREFNLSNRVTDDPDTVRDRSRTRTFHVPRYLAHQLEMARQARIGRERGEFAVTLRRALLGQ